MMPGAANCASYKEAANKGGAIMRACGANREHLIAAADKEHRFIADVAKKHGPVGNGRNLNSLREIWPAGLGIFLVHFNLSSHIEKSAASRWSSVRIYAPRRTSAQLTHKPSRER
jgi:hypothetical protein